MIVWLASYPKSGNTFLRSLLTSYFYSEDGNFGFDLLKETNQFPDKDIFDRIGIDIKDKYKVAENYLRAQEEINKSNKLELLKTHSSFCKMYNKFNFSSLNSSLGVIYIVRDPRNVLLSFARHNSQTISKTFDLMINEKTIGNEEDQPEVYMGSWSFHYNSWKIYRKQKKYFLVKYEDLINDTKNIFIKILEFINNLISSKFIIDDSKLLNTIKSTKFSKMKKLEEKFGFKEAKINENTGETIPFFNLGPKNDWKKLLDYKTKIELENTFKKEMEELEYL